VAKATDDNIGQMGEDSIRIGGKAIGDLPVRDGVEARGQLEEQRKRDRRIEILKEHGRYKVPNLIAQLNQCEGNLKRMRDVCAQEESSIGELKMHIRQAKLRDEKLEREGLVL
jgi:hypothetical protein